MALNKGREGERAAAGLEADEPAALLLLPRGQGPWHLGAAGHRGPVSSVSALPGQAGSAGKGYR